MASAPYGLITVRLGSSRLNQKCLLEFGVGNVIEHVIRRAACAGFAPVIATTDQPADDALEAIAKAEGALCFRGSERDKLQRWADACDAFGIDDFHTIDADDPFFDGPLGHRSLALLRQGYDIVYPSSVSYLASVGYSLRADVVRRACELKTTDDTEMMWYHVEKVPGLRGIELAVPEARVRNVRLTLDYAEDYWLLRTVLRILGPDATFQQIEDLFLSNPRLTDVNWFRNDEWKQAQEAKRV